MTLFAKSSQGNGEKLRLTQHTSDVCEAATLLFGSPGRPSRLGTEWLRFFKLPSHSHGTFCQTLDVAAAFHDWGKANQGFQEALEYRGEQSMRHEHLSALLLALPTVWDAVTRARADLDWGIVLAAVLSHHLQATPRSFAEKLTGLPKLRVLSDDPDFRELMDATWRRLGVGDVRVTIAPWWSFETANALSESVPKQKQRAADLLDEIDEVLTENEPRRRLLWAVRAALIVADGIASGLRRTDQSIGDWTAENLQQLTPCGPSDIDNIIEQRKTQLEDAGKWRGWSEFQLGCETKSPRTLLLAPCGSGKTLAAWRWILARVRERPATRVIFLYPTRATATEGFRDYVSWAPEADAGLIHGTAGYELPGMFDPTPLSNDPRGRKDFQQSVDPRLFAFGYWSKRIFSATVDQFLAFLQYAYGPTCLLPVLADSVVVVDETHSFDHAMFSALKTLLKEFDLPVLCMTATLPPQRQRELQACGLEVYDDKPGDLSAIANADRYTVGVTTEADAIQRVTTALAENKRVLWVVNLVRRAQLFAATFGVRSTPDGLTTASGEPVLCYHSRFTLNDRKAWHSRVVKAFQDDSQPRCGVLAVTTQVCEMSLDLDADVLITEFAPVTALIQRMGRCNRKTKLPLASLGEILVYEPADPRDCEKPYDAEALLGAREFLARLTSGPVSQVQLEEALRLAPHRRPVGDKLCRFTESGPYADSREESFRDIDEFSQPGVLDVDEYLATGRAYRPGLIVPVPRHFHAKTDSRLPRHLVVAPAARYDPALGLLEPPRA